jgi:phage gp29-like protein
MADMDEKNKETPPMVELLSPSNYNVGAFMTPLLNRRALPDDPTWCWEQIKFNPAIAMAIYEDMEMKDTTIASALEARKRNVLSKERYMVAGGEKKRDQKIRDHVEETLEGYTGGVDGLSLGFENVLYEAADAYGKGVAIGECIWNYAPDGRVFLQDIKFKPQYMFQFSEGPFAEYGGYFLPQTGPLRLRPDLGLMLGGVENVDLSQPLDPRKFFVHTFRPRQGNRWGQPLLRDIFWLSWFKRAALKEWLRLCEKGSGTVIARYDQGAGDAELALKTAQAIVEQKEVAVSKRTEVEVLDHVRQNMSDAYMHLVDSVCDNGIIRFLRGQTLTSRGSEGGGSRALGQVHQRGEDRITETDAKSLMFAVNTQIVFPLTYFNHGAVDRPPLWMIRYQPSADLAGTVNWLYRLWQMMVPIKKKFVYETFPLEEPGETDEVLAPPSTDQQTAAEPANVGEAAAAFAEFAEAEGVTADEALVAFSEAVKEVKKKSPVTRSGNTRLKPPVSKRQRFAKLRPSMID